MTLSWGAGGGDVRGIHFTLLDRDRPLEGGGFIGGRESRGVGGVGSAVCVCVGGRVGADGGDRSRDF